MILFQNHLIVLGYDPGTDILSVEWPSVNAYDLMEIERTMDLLVDYIRNYDVKRLLIDSSSSNLSPEVNMETYMQILTRFATNLQKTRLMKSASIVHEDRARQEQSDAMADKVRQKMMLQIERRTFSSKAEALKWLTEEE